MSRETRGVPTSATSSEPVATAPVLARWLGISGKAVYDFAKAGVLVRVNRDHFLLEESVRRYCEHIRQQASQPEPIQGEQPTASEVGNSAANTAPEMVALSAVKHHSEAGSSGSTIPKGPRLSRGCVKLPTAWPERIT